MDEKISKASDDDSSPDYIVDEEGNVNPADRRKIRPGHEDITSLKSVGEWAEFEDSSQGSPIPRIPISSGTSGKVVRRESATSSEVPLMYEEPEVSTEAAARSEKSPGKKSIFTKAKGVAAKGLQAVSRSLSPRKEQQKSPKASGGIKGASSMSSGSKGASLMPPGIQGSASMSSGSKGASLMPPGIQGSASAPSGIQGSASVSPKKATASGSESSQKVWTKFKKTVSSGMKRRPEDEKILTGEKFQAGSFDDDSTEPSVRERTTPQKTKLVPSSTSSVSSPLKPVEKPGASGGKSAAPGTPAKEKRSRFSALINLGRRKPPVRDLKWRSLSSSEIASLETSSSADPTEEMDIDTPRDKTFPTIEVTEDCDVEGNIVDESEDRGEITEDNDSKDDVFDESEDRGEITEDNDSKENVVDEIEDKGTSAGTTATDDEKEIMQVDDSSRGVDIEEEAAKDDSPLDE